MKLAALALLLLFGFPIGLYILLGKEAFSDANIVLGMIGVGAALFVMGCLFTAKNVLSTFFDFLLITFGGFLLLIGAFARPLGLFESEEGQEIEQRIMQHAPPAQVEKPSPAVAEKDPGQKIDEIVGESIEPAPQPAPVEKPVEENKPDLVKENPVPPKKDPEAVQKETAVKEEKAKEGLELFAEESGQD